MARELRHVTIPDCHDRIPLLGVVGIRKITLAGTEQLRASIRHLAQRLLLADHEWALWYAIKDELIERGAWSEDLAHAGR